MSFVLSFCSSRALYTAKTIHEEVLHVCELTKIQRLEWKVRVLTFASTLSFLIIVACGWTFRQQQSDVLRVRQIVIVDEKETEPVWIGAPVPDPIVQGQRQKRSGPVSGIILLDANGQPTRWLTSLKMAPASYS